MDVNHKSFPQTVINIALDHIAINMGDLCGLGHQIRNTGIMGDRSVKSVCVSAMLCIKTVCKYSSHLIKSIFDREVNINYYQMTKYAGLIAITVISALSVAVGTVLAASVINAGYTSVKMLFDPTVAPIGFKVTLMAAISLLTIVWGPLFCCFFSVLACNVIGSWRADKLK